MYDQGLPPHDIQAEEGVVAALMIAPESIPLVRAILEPRHFFREAAAWTYEAELRLFERGDQVNQVTVAHELERNGKLEEVGGLWYLSEVILNLPTPVGVENVAKLVVRDAIYRELIRAAYALAQDGYQATADIDDCLERCMHRLQHLRAAAGLLRGSQRHPYYEA